MLLLIAVLLVVTGGSWSPTVDAGTTPDGQGGGRPTATPTPKPRPRATPRTTPTTRTVKPSTQAPQPRRIARPAQAQSFSENLNGATLEMVLIPAGTFMMGSPVDEGGGDEHPRHRVSVPQFYMGKYEVTQAQYRAVIGTNPSHFKDDTLPVENVSWSDAQEFCRKLSQMTGRKYRLATEAEWEYACRAGTTGAYAGALDAMGWYRENSGGIPHPVGQKQPNTWGLYDMHGNVWEWCQSKYQGYPYRAGDGREILTGGDTYTRVARGGSWDSVEAVSSSTFRYVGSSPSSRRANNLGFRVVVVA